MFIGSRIGCSIALFRHAILSDNLCMCAAEWTTAEMNDDVQASILARAADRFGVAVSQLSPLTGGNFAQVCEWARDGGQGCVLKIAPVQGDDDLQSQRAMLAWLNFLAAHDAPVVRPVSSPQGNLIEPVEHEGRTYLVSASEKISGLRAEMLPPSQWDADLIQVLGRAIGRCHAVAQMYAPPDASLRRPDWRQGASCFNPLDDLASAESFVLNRRAQVLKLIDALPRDHESYGLAHLDIHFANFIVDTEHGGVVLIDFDDCAYGWYAMDVAMLVFDVKVVYTGQTDAMPVSQFLEFLLKGYRAEKDFPAFWAAQLPAFLKLLEIGLYAMLAPDYDPLTCQDGWVSKFMLGREHRIREGIPYLD